MQYSKIALEGIHSFGKCSVCMTNLGLLLLYNVRNGPACRKCFYFLHNLDICRDKKGREVGRTGLGVYLDSSFEGDFPQEGDLL